MLIKVVWGSANMVLPWINLHWIRGHPRPAARRFQSFWHCGQRLQGPHGGDGEDTKCGEGNECWGTFRKAAGVDAEFVKVREGTCRISGNEETCISKVIQCLSFNFSSKGSILPPLPTFWTFSPMGIILQKWPSIWQNCSTGNNILLLVIFLIARAHCAVLQSWRCLRRKGVSWWRLPTRWWPRMAR